MVGRGTGAEEEADDVGPARWPTGLPLVLDASVVIEMLASTPLGRQLASHLLTDQARLHAPALLDVEVLQVLRRLERGRTLSWDHAERAVALLDLLPIERHELRSLGGRIWALRHNFTAYDAAYIGVCEAVGATLLTRDMRLARSATSLIPVRAV